MILGKTEKFSKKGQKRLKDMIEHAYHGVTVSFVTSKHAKDILIIEATGVEKCAELLFKDKGGVDYILVHVRGILFTFEHLAYEMGWIK